MKKIVVLILTLCLLLPSLALAAVTAPGTFPITDTPEELSIFTTITAVQDPYEDDYQTKFYEEKTGVKVNWLTYNNNEIATQYNLSLASQEYPDIYVYIQDASGWMELIDEEIIIPLDDLIENHTVYLKKYLEENPDVKAAVTAPDGHIYTLPQVRYEECESTYSQKMWVYKEWMDAYCKATGNAIPTTTEEFKQMLIYFRDNDMNGNGDAADEIPLTGTYSRWSSGSDPLFYLMNSFIYCPFTFLVADENNNITTPVVEDAYREGLRYINDLYKEGLLYEGTYVQELTQFRAMTSVAKDAVTVGAAAAGYPMRLLTQGSGMEAWDLDMDRILADRKRTLALYEWLKKANEIRITTKRGTDLTCKVGDAPDGMYPVMGIIPFYGEVAIVPSFNSVNGVVIADGASEFAYGQRGFPIRPAFAGHQELYKEPMKLVFKDSMLVEYDGDPVQKARLAKLMDDIDPKPDICDEVGLVTTTSIENDMYGWRVDGSHQTHCIHVALGNNRRRGEIIHSDEHVDFDVHEPVLTVDGITVYENGAFNDEVIFENAEKAKNA